MSTYLLDGPPAGMAGIRNESARVELLKWVAFGGMVVDHLSRSGLGLAWMGQGAWWAWGRMALPLFILTFAWVVVIAKGGQLRVWKLAGLAALAQPAHVWVFGSPWWAANVLLIFPVAWAIWRLSEQGRLRNALLICVLFLVGGVLLGPHSYGFLGLLSTVMSLFGWSSHGKARALWFVGSIASWVVMVPGGWVPLIGVATVWLVAGRVPVEWLLRLTSWRTGGFGWWYVLHLWLISLALALHN